MSIFSSLKDKVTQHVEVYVKLFKLNFIDRTSNLLSYFMFAMICMLLMVCIMLFLGFGLSELFQVACGMSKMWAFFSTLGVYVIILIIVMGLRKNVTRFFASGFIRALTEGDEEDEKKQND